MDKRRRLTLLGVAALAGAALATGGVAAADSGSGGAGDVVLQIFSDDRAPASGPGDQAATQDGREDRDCPYGHDQAPANTPPPNPGGSTGSGAPAPDTGQL